MASSSRVLDLFPNLTRSNLEQISFNRDKKIFKELAIKNHVTAFKVCIISHKIVMHLLKNEWDRLIMDNYINNFTKSFELNPFQPEKFIWENVEKKLSKNVFKDQSKNSDIRTCYRIDNNKFLVKCSFTFGRRTVEKGTVHFIQTTTAPMLFYKLDEQRKTTRVPCAKDSCFLARDEMCYDKFVLQPNTLYEVPPKTVYVLMAVQKTLFSLHITLQNSGLARGQSPFLYKKFIQNPYTLIPETPLPVGRSMNSDVPQKYIGVFQVDPRIESLEMDTDEMVAPEITLPSTSSEELPPPSPVVIREEDLLRDIMQRNQIFPQQQPEQIVFVVNPTRLVRGIYDYPKPENPPLWIELDKIIENRNDIFPKDDSEVEPLDLSMNGLPDETFISFTPLHLDENVEIPGDLNILLQELENELKDKF